MDGAGGWVGWWADPAGSGKHCVGLLPPTGIGLQLDLPGVVAGGFLDFTGGPSDRYGGVITLKIAPPGGLRGVTVTAFGVHELAGSEGDSNRDSTFIIVLGTRFTPGWPSGPASSGRDSAACMRTTGERHRRPQGTADLGGNREHPLRRRSHPRRAAASWRPGNALPTRPGVQVFGLTAQFGWVPLFGDYLMSVR